MLATRIKELQAVKRLLQQESLPSDGAEVCVLDAIKAIDGAVGDLEFAQRDAPLAAARNSARPSPARASD